MITLFLIIVAAFFNAVMDATENENFFESRLKGWNQKFWYKRESWKYARKICGYHLDAWHLAKTCMVVVLCTAIFCEQFSHQVWHTGNIILDIISDIVIAGIVWNCSFILFYHRLLQIK